jgi:hypothetical protein
LSASLQDINNAGVANPLIYLQISPQNFDCFLIALFASVWTGTQENIKAPKRTG